MFCALIKKELKEYYWIPGVGVILYFVLFNLQEIDYTPYMGGIFQNIPIPIAMDQYSFNFMLLCYGMAISLGLIMLWKENLNNTWQFLIQHPVTKKQIFESKLFAGIIVGALPILSLYLLQAIWSAIPGNYPAPWTIEYLYPTFKIIVASFLLFIGTLLTGFLNEKWKAFRMMFFGSTLFFIICSQATSYWLTSLVCLSIIVLFQLSIGWSLFVTKKTYRVTFSLFSLPCLTFVCAFILILMLNIVLLFIPFDENDNYYSGFFDFLSLTKNSSQRAIKMYNKNNQYRFFNGDFMTLQSTHKRKKIKSFFNIKKVPKGLAFHKYVPHKITHPVVDHFSGFHKSSELYYFLHDENLVVCYNRASSQVVGYIGRKGFSEQKELVEPFPEGQIIITAFDFLGQFLIQCDKEVYLLEVRQDFALIALHPEKLHSWLSVARFRGNDQRDSDYPKSWPDYVTIFRTEKNILVYSSLREKPFIQFKLPALLAQKKTLNLIFLEDNLLGIIAESGRNKSTLSLYKINSQGEILSQEKHSIESKFLQKEIKATNYFFWNKYDWAISFVPGISPFSLGVLATSSLFLEDKLFEHFIPRKTKQKSLAIFSLILFLKSFLCGVLGYFLLRYRNLSKARHLGWSFFSFLGGIPALLILWATILQEEKRVSCAQCKTEIVPSYSLCPQCNTPWPKAEERETNIFVKATQA